MASPNALGSNELSQQPSRVGLDSGSGTVAPLAQFHLFSKLPGELQLKIWPHAVHLFPQVLYLDKAVVYDSNSDGEPFNENGRLMCHREWRMYSSFAGIPAILQATSDSRAAALKVYKLSFHGLHRKGYPLYFNPVLDKLLVANSFGCALSKSLRAPALLADFALVRHVAREDFFGYRRRGKLTSSANEAILPNFRWFLRLETLTFDEPRGFLSPRPSVFKRQMTQEKWSKWWMNEMQGAQRGLGIEVTSGPVCHWLPKEKVDEEWFAGLRAKGQKIPSIYPPTFLAFDRLDSESKRLYFTRLSRDFESRFRFDISERKSGQRNGFVASLQPFDPDYYYSNSDSDSDSDEDQDQDEFSHSCFDRRNLSASRNHRFQIWCRRHLKAIGGAHEERWEEEDASQEEIMEPTSEDDKDDFIVSRRQTRRKGKGKGKKGKKRGF